MKNNILTIITVTYNCEKTLQRTIDSVLNQDFDLYEYLIIDGQSTDRTLDIIKDNIHKFNGKMRYISEKDNGLYDAMNKGIHLSRGEYIGIINGDDYYNENIFNDIINKFEKENADIIYSDLLFTAGDIIDIKNPLIANHNKLNERMSVNHPTCFVRKSVYEEFGNFDLCYKIASDYELMVRFFVSGCKFYKSEKVLAIMESGGLSSNNKKSVQEKYLIHKKYFSESHALKLKVKNLLKYYYRKKKKRYGEK